MGSPPARAEAPAEDRGTGEPAGPGPSSLAGGVWRIRGRVLAVERPLVMGILNLTPDSFSDGGELEDLPAALARAEALVDEGADILDVGGESTRPGAGEVPEDREKARILPFLREAARRLRVPLSVDTRKAGVARAALEAGAHVVNDVSGLTHDPRMAAVVADAGAGVVVMHMRGDPATMASRARYGDVTGEVLEELRASLELAGRADIPPESVVLDPGIGFAKTAEQSLTLLRELGRLAILGRPLLVGPSRKSFLGRILELPPARRVEGTVAACVVAYLHGARIFRVHDVQPVVRALRVAEAIHRGLPHPSEPADQESTG